jgi:hypothetical protein
MKSIIAGLSLIGAVAGQIAGTVSQVPASVAATESVDSAASVPSAGASVSASFSAPTDSAVSVSSFATDAASSSVEAVSSPPAPIPTPAPAGPSPPSGSSGPSSDQFGGFYDIMPYQSYQSGGYKSLECGYGYSKQNDGSCQPESWVRLPSIPIFSVHLTHFPCSITLSSKGVTQPSLCK